MIESPCGLCETRGCGAFHDKCKLYQEFKAKKEREYERKKEAYEKQKLLVRYTKRRKVRENSPVKCHKK